MGESQKLDKRRKPSNTTAKAAARGLERQARGEKPSLAQLRAIESERRRALREKGLEWARAVPKSDFAFLADRQVVQINAQAERYGMPTGDKTIDLAAFVRWVYDLLAKHGDKLRSPQESGSDPLLVGAADSPALERYRLAKAIAAERENLAAERNLVPAVLVQQGHARIGARLKWAGEQLAKRFGDMAADILRQAIEASQADVEQILKSELAGKNEQLANRPKKPKAK